MASSLRKRLGKRQAVPDPKGSNSDGEISAGESTSSLESMKSRLTQKQQSQQTVPNHDLSTTPPPSDRKVKSSKEKLSRNVTPPQSLLDRYKNCAAKALVTTSSPVKPAKTKDTYHTGKETAFSENFDDATTAALSDWVNVPDTPEREISRDTRVYNGVQFEMMGKKGKAGEAPVADASEEDFVYERRATRSQSRRQERADSQDLTTQSKDSTKNDSHLVPPSLTIRKTGEKETAHTPSPHASDQGPDLVGPTPSNSPRNSAVPPQLPPLPLVERSKDATSSPNHPLSPDPIIGKPTFSLPHRRKPSDPLASSQSGPPSPFGASTTPVCPPPYNPSIASGYQWTSHLSSSSRPDDPWGWLKTWTCCRCARLDPTGRERPAATMVEQKACSRLACGHTRCAMGCRIMRDSKYDVPGVY